MNSEPGPDLEGAAASQPTAAKLKAYINANAGKFTDEAITTELARAGYDPEEVRTALATAQRDTSAQTSRAVWVILIAYGATFALLTIGMLSNSVRPSGCCTPNSDALVMVLAVSMGIALIVSLISVGNRRAGLLALSLLLGLAGAVTLASGVGLVLLPLGILLAVLALRRAPRPSSRKVATLGSLLAVPMVLLVIVAGLCVATGLPVPHGV